MTKAEREAFAQLLYEEYNDTKHGQISYESLALMHGCATTTVFRLVHLWKAKVEGQG